MGTRVISVLVTDFLERVFGADVRSLTDLTYTSRRALLERHPFPSGEVPALSVGSSFGRRSLEGLDGRLQGALLWPAASYVLARYGTPCDELVPLADAKVPGSTFVELRSSEHGDTVFAGGIGFPVPRRPVRDPRPLTPALALQLLEQAPPPAPGAPLGAVEVRELPPLPARPDRAEVDRRFYLSQVVYLVSVELSGLTPRERARLGDGAKAADPAGLVAGLEVAVAARVRRGLGRAREHACCLRLDAAERAAVELEGLPRALAAARTGASGRVTAESGLVVRREPDAGSARLTALAWGAHARVLGVTESAEGARWFRVQSAVGITGYVHGDHMEVPRADGLSDALPELGR